MMREREARARDILRFVRAQRKSVLSFVGYSGSGYEDPQAMLAGAARILDVLDPARTLVNSGATADGIGAVYALAQQRGFATMGIVSSVARDAGVALSPQVEHVFYVRDGSWGGRLAGSTKLAPTSAAVVAASHCIVAIGGGDIARDELRAARRVGIPVLFIAADMNHRAAIDKARRNGQAEPVDFGGSAQALYARRRIIAS